MRRFDTRLIREMDKDQRELRTVGIPEDEILHHLVEHYHPTNIEVRRVRFPLAEFMANPENERMLLSEIYWREEKRQFNRTQRLNQEIAVVKTPWETIDGKIGIVYLLYLVAGKQTEDALARLKKVQAGNQEKENRLLDKRANERRFRNVARNLERSIEKRRNNRKGGGSP